MEGKNTLLNELRLLNISLQRVMRSVCGFEEHKLPAVSSMIVHDIFRKGGSGGQKVVENEFDLRRSTASQQLNKLERSGYITREVSQTDGRSKRIFLSEKAVREQSEIKHKFDEIENYLQSALLPDEREKFFVLCGKIRSLCETPNNARGGV